MGRQYTYEGAVYAFNDIVSYRWKASTWAVSKEKAIANLKYRFRKSAGMIQSIPITFSGKITVS